MYHEAHLRRFSLQLSVIILNLVQASLPFESSVLVGGFDHCKNSPQALLWEA
jgi:hypothetical protein